MSPPPVLVTPHHGPADDVHRVGDCGPTALRNQGRGRGADRDLKQAGTCHLAGDRDHAPGHRVPVHGPAHGIKRADVGHHRPHVEWQAERRDGAAEQFVHQDVFVARRVEVVQLGQLDACPGNRARKPRGDL